VREQLDILTNDSTTSNQHLEIIRQNLHAQLQFSVVDIEAPTPDIHHTFFQDPIVVEDAFGWKFPVPSEYDLSVNIPIQKYFTTKWPLCLQTYRSLNLFF
jgi:hypothetical protein